MAHAMPADAARLLICAVRDAGVGACVGGGWSVDALLGTASRPHNDLDLWVLAQDLPQLFVTLGRFHIDRVMPVGDDRPWNFVLHDGGTRRVDLHLYERLDGGELRYGRALDPFLFGAGDLTGHGSIDGADVCCESPEFALRCHTGYEPRAVDRHDVAALCTRFGLSLPCEYR